MVQIRCAFIYIYSIVFDVAENETGGVQGDGEGEGEERR